MAGSEGDLAHSPAAEAGYRRALDEADALAHEATSEAGVSPIADEPPEGLWRAKECVRPNCARVAQASGARLDFRREYRIQRNTITIGERDAERYCEVVQPCKGIRGADIFVHISAVERAGLSTLNDGKKVSFEEERDPKRGKTSAVNVKVL